MTLRPMFWLTVVATAISLGAAAGPVAWRLGGDEGRMLPQGSAPPQIQVQSILGTTLATGNAAPTVTVDARANLLLLRSDQETYDLVQRVVADLDVPGRAIPSTIPVTQVYALRFADATSLSDVLRGLVGSGSTVYNPVAAALPAAAAPFIDPATGTAVEGADVRIVAPPRLWPRSRPKTLPSSRFWKAIPSSCAPVPKCRMILPP